MLLFKDEYFVLSKNLLSDMLGNLDGKTPANLEKEMTPSNIHLNWSIHKGKYLACHRGKPDTL